MRVAVADAVRVGVAVGLGVGVLVAGGVAVTVPVGVGWSTLVNVHCSAVLGSSAKMTWLSPGWKLPVGLMVAPTMLKVPEPGLKAQAMFDSVEVDWRTSNTSKSGPQATGFAATTRGKAPTSCVSRTGWDVGHIPRR